LGKKKGGKAIFTFKKKTENQGKVKKIGQIGKKRTEPGKGKKKGALLRQNKERDRQFIPTSPYRAGGILFKKKRGGKKKSRRLRRVWGNL